MDRITDSLYIADIEQAGRHRNYRKHGIDAVVRLTHAPPERGYPDTITPYERPMMDGPRNDPEKLQQAVADTVSLLENDESVVVHCSAGASRSAAVIAAALATYQGHTLQEAISRVKDVREIEIHPAVVANAEKALEEV